tara:strand:- start:2661 stop:3680 length:1020 start_codon:yes stop_codon:yes gene_type:complete
MGDNSRISLETAQKIAAAWNISTSLGEAMEIAGIKSKDRRAHQRYRRRAEEILGIVLLSHNPKQSQSAKLFLPQSSRQLDFKKKSVVVSFSDCHWWPNQGVTDAHKILLKVIKDIKPDAVGCRGDMMDGAALSRHPRAPYSELPSTEDEVVQTIEFMDEIAYEATKAKRKVDLDLNVGNHERIEVAAAQMYGTTEDEVLAGILASVGEKDKTAVELMLPDWNISTSTVINGIFMWKHKPHRSGINARHNSPLNAGISTGNGHTHRLGVTYVSDFNGTRHGVECGTLANPYSEQFNYCEDGFRNWQSGFVVQVFDGDMCESIPVHVYKGRAMFNGKVYKA